MAQELKAFVALADIPKISFSPPHSISQSSITSFLGNQICFSDYLDTRNTCTWYTYMHRGKSSYTQKNVKI